MAFQIAGIVNPAASRIQLAFRHANHEIYRTLVVLFSKLHEHFFTTSTFELRRDQQQDARPMLAKCTVYRQTWPGPAAGAPLERGVGVVAAMAA